MFKSLARMSISIAAFLYAVFVVFKLYGWYVVPLGIPSVKYGTMFGLVALIAIFRMKDPDPNTTATRELTLTIARAMVYTTYLGIGWVLHRG